MKSKKLLLAGVSAICAAVLILLLRTVDVAPIGPEGTGIGLSRLNQAVFSLFGVHMLWYHITDWLGVAAILTAFLFAVMGLVQLIRRRSLIKVDREILVLGGLYIVVIGLYLLFETAVVNWRPVLMPGCEHPEASFPSSHTMITLVIMGSAMMLLPKYVKGSTPRRILRAACVLIIGITVIGRLISGVHWLTDILGGILISTALLALYSALTQE